MFNPNKNYLSWLSVLLVAAIANGSLYAKQLRQSISIEDLAQRIRIPLISLAPDGSRVAYLSVEGLPMENQYEITLNLQTTDGKSQPLLLGQYRLPPGNVFEKDTDNIQRIAGQFVWSPDSKELAYSAHVGLRMAVRVRTLSSGRERIVVTGFERIEIAPKNGQLELVTTRSFPVKIGTRTEPDDLSLFVKDGYRFFGPLSNPKIQGEYIVQHWDYIWGSAVPTKTKEPDSVSYFEFPQEWVETKPASGVKKKTADTEIFARNAIPSPNAAVAAMVEDSTRNLGNPLLAYRAAQIVLKDLKNDGEGTRILVPSGRPRAVLRILGWGREGTELYYVSLGPRFSSLSSVSLNGTVREICKEESEFSLPNPSSEISDDRRTVVFVRTTNLIPDELVKVDLKTGIRTVLWSPNDKFKTKAQSSVRFVPIECCDADFYGRLYLPADYDKAKRYPLVFTNYISGPGFDASVGDEVPVLALVGHGIAVFAMNSREANIPSTTGDFRLEINRVEKPLRAMEWAHRKLADEGVIDPDRCGLTGLSYGAEIAMYAYWKSRVFRAVSVATGSWEPMNYVLGGIPYSRFLDSRGFAIPDAGSYPKWKDLSAGLNVRPDLPPLLVQSPDGEEYFTVETWFRLRRNGAAVEWYEYPGEGHVKRGPANKWWVYKRNLDWFRFWLKGEEDPNPATTEQYARWHELRKVGAQTDVR